MERLFKIIRNLIPPKKWQLPVIVLLGAIFGLAIFIAKLANVGSYLTDDPTACINCHVMTPQYSSWQHSSHREVAVCNDCHVPHDNVINKYMFKAKDGLYHASIYTLRAEPQVIVMHGPGRKVVQQNCIRCHADQVTDAQTQSLVADHHSARTDRQCWECHRQTPHGQVKSLSSVGYYIEPLSIQNKTKPFVPEWLVNKLEETKNNQ